MKTKKIDKTKPRNWVEGDIFAIEIKNTNTEYDGKYIILNKFINPQWNSLKSNHHFRARITNGKCIPTIEEIEKLEYVKTRHKHFYERYWPARGHETFEECVKRQSHRKYYPDEFNYLYSYCVELIVKRKDNYADFIYLGNYNLGSPEDEFQEDSQHSIFTLHLLKPDLVIKVINAYEKYNRKKSDIYEDEGRKRIEEYAKKELQFHIDLMNNFSKYLEENNIQFSDYAKEEEEDDGDYYHETYVGGDILTNDEKQYDDEC